MATQNQIFVDMGRFIAQKIEALMVRIDTISERVKGDISHFDNNLTIMQSKQDSFYTDFTTKLQTSTDTFTEKVVILDSYSTFIDTFKTKTEQDAITNTSEHIAFDFKIKQNETSLNTLSNTITAQNVTISTLDTKIQTNTDQLNTRINTLLELSESDKDSFAELVNYIKSVDLTNDQAFDSYVISNNTRSSNIETFVNNLEARVVVVANDLTTYNTNTTNSIATLENNILTEKSRIDAMLSLAEADKDSFVEIVGLINTIDAENDDALLAFKTNTDITLNSHTTQLANRYTKDQANITFLGIEANAVSASKLATPRTITLTGDLSGSVQFDGSSDVIMSVEVDSTEHNHNTIYLGINAKAIDSDKLDNLDSTQFLRSDVSSTISGDFTVSSATPKFNLQGDGFNTINMSMTTSSRGLNVYKTSTPNTIILKVENDATDAPALKENGVLLSDKYALKTISNDIGTINDFTIGFESTGA